MRRCIGGGGVSDNDSLCRCLCLALRLATGWQSRNACVAAHAAGEADRNMPTMGGFIRFSHK
jgi:hypothetical protein